MVDQVKIRRPPASGLLIYCPFQAFQLFLLFTDQQLQLCPFPRLPVITVIDMEVPVFFVAFKQPALYCHAVDIVIRDRVLPFVLKLALML